METHIRERVLRRLKRIAGQVRGVERMVEEGRECPEILQQIASIREALNGAARTILEGHVRFCTQRVRSTQDPQKEQELLETILRSLEAWR